MTSAFVLLNVKTGSEDELLNELKKIKGIKEAHRVYGVYDTIIKVEAESLEKLKEVLTWKIRRLPNIKSTLTMIVVEE
ncbi:MAG: Lrp/AsnC ligand binding domain-containing protein [archaeon]|nr:Lrp/AsnC ligand binding domain-containing protein [archaeon]MCP8306394.1 Lrp/AsnC ligand binding domain-containing protein [archaeon]